MSTKFEIIEGFPEQKLGTYVGWNEYEIDLDRLWTDGIGSCLAVAIYDPENKLGALTHLTGFRDSRLVHESLYAENVVNTLISNFGNYKRLEAVITGESLNEHKISDIVKRDLNSFNVSLIGENLGQIKSIRGREVHFNCQTGRIKVYRYPPLF